MQLNLPKKILNSTFKIFIEVFITDRKIRRLLKGKFAQLYLKKYTNKALHNPKVCPISKLSFKPKVLGLTKTKTTNNTYLEKLLNGDLK